jgi:hypothetical protein
MHERNNKGTVGSGVFYAVRAGDISGEPKPEKPLIQHGTMACYTNYLDSNFYQTDQSYLLFSFSVKIQSLRRK